MTDATPLRHPDTIAAGDWLLVYTQVTAIDLANRCACIDTARGSLWYDYKNFFSVPADLENGTKKSEKAPAHDKKRIFRAGDIVRPCQRDGREPWGYTDTTRTHLNLSWKLTVLQDEARGMVKCQTGSGTVFETSPFFLELVTPVEEFEPYYVEQQGEKSGGLCFTVLKRNGYAEATFYFGTCRSRTEQQAQAAAAAECARLNAEWRKEQPND